MQIFSPSHIRSSSRNNARGFTLIELLISASIIGIVSTIVLVKYGNFDSTILLKGAAYEVALNLREAQVKSVSVSGESGQFNYPYGVSFTPTSKTYTAFRFEDATDWPQHNSPDAVDVSTITLARTMQVDDVCIITDYDPSTVVDCDIDRLDISFRRPEFKALFYAEDESGVSIATSTILGAQIKLNSTGGNTSVFYAQVSSLGQISIKKE